MSSPLPRLSLYTLLLACCMFSGASHGEGLAATDAWIREAPPSATVHAGYLTLSNNGTGNITITGVYSPDYGSGEIHRSWVEDGIARMQPLEQLVVVPGESLRLEPGGHHLMLFRPQRTLREGDTVTLRLGTSDGDCLAVSARVKRADPPARAH